MENVLKRARKNIVLKLTAEGLIRFLSVLFVVFVARGLGDADYGRYSLAYFFAALLTLFSDWGLNTVLIRDVSRRRDLLPSYGGNVLSLKMLLSGASLVAAGPLLGLMGYDPKLIGMILVSMFYLQFNHILDFFVALTNSVEKMEVELLIKGLYKTLTVCLPLLFLYWGGGLWGVLLGLVLGYLLSLIFSWAVIRAKITSLIPLGDTRLWRRLFRSAWPIGLSGLFMTVYARIDMVLLSLFRVPPEEIGWYAVPVKIIEMCSLFPLLVMAGLFPIFSVLNAEDRQLLGKSYEKALILLAVLSVPVLLFLFVLSEDWLTVFFGRSFSPSIPALKILAFSLPLVFLNYVLFHTLIALNREKIITGVSALAVVFNIGSNCLVLPRYGYLGASGTTVATDCLILVLFLVHLQRSFWPLPWGKTAAKLILSGGMMALPFWLLKNGPAWLMWLTALASYGGCLFLSRLIGREDWILFKKMIGLVPASVDVRK